jgi:hypothetical protein
LSRVTAGGIEALDDHEAALLALRTELGLVGCLSGGCTGVGGRGESSGRVGLAGEQDANAVEFFGPVSVGEKAVVSNAHEAPGQDVEQEPAKKLDPVEGHGSLSALAGIVLVAERDLGVLERDQALIGDGDPVGVPGEVVEDLVGTAERRFGVDDPFFASQGVQPAVPGVGMFEFGAVSVETE